MAPSDQFVRNAELVRVIDGDTLLVDLDLGWTHRMQESIRLLGVDTPEPRGAERAAGKFVTERLLEFIGDQTQLVVESRQFDLGKFGRTLGYVWVNGTCINTWLLESGLAWPTDHDGNLLGSRNLSTLTLPQSVMDASLENET